MKLFYTFILLLLFSYSKCFPQINVKDVAFWPTTKNFGGIAFYNEMAGWISGEDGLLLKTTDGGHSWEEFNTGYNIPPYNLILIDSMNMILNRQIYSTNGGTSWQLIQYPDSTEVNHLHAFGPAEWIAAGNNGLIIKTTDSGASWTTLMHEPGARSSGLSFTDSLNGWYTKRFSSQNGLYKSTDGGNTWSFVSSEYLFSPIFIDNLIGYAGGSGPSVVKSTDGGLSWNTILGVEFFRGFYAADSINIYVWSGYNTNSNGGPRLHYSSNGGVSWSQVLGGNFKLNDVCVNNNTAWVAGEAGYAAKATDLSTFKSLMGDYMYGVYAFKDKAIVTGWGGELYIVKDEGQTWVPIESDIYAGPNYITFTGGDTVGIIAGRKVWRSSDGGYSWNNIQQFNELSYKVLKDVNGDLYLIQKSGNVGRLYRSPDYGLSWREILLPQQLEMFSEFFSYDSLNLWITSDYYSRVFFRTTNGGADWIPVSSSVTAYQFFSPDSGIGFLNTTLSYSSNGGVTWHPMSANNYYNIAQQYGFRKDFSYFTSQGEYLPGDESLYSYIFYLNYGAGVYGLKSYIAKYVSSFSFYDESNGWIAAGRQVFRVTGSVLVSAIIEDDINSAPVFSLAQNYPNPFNPSTIIKFSVPAAGLVTLKIYDILGREVRTLINSEYTPGNYSIEFNARGLSSGVYFYRLIAEGYSDVKKMQVMK